MSERFFGIYAAKHGGGKPYKIRALRPGPLIRPREKSTARLWAKEDIRTSTDVFFLLLYGRMGGEKEVPARRRLPFTA